MYCNCFYSQLEVLHANIYIIIYFHFYTDIFAFDLENNVVLMLMYSSMWHVHDEVGCLQIEMTQSDLHLLDLIRFWYWFVLCRLYLCCRNVVFYYVAFKCWRLNLKLAAWEHVILLENYEQTNHYRSCCFASWIY